MFILLVYGGYVDDRSWRQGQSGHGAEAIANAVIGLAVVLSAYAIANFVLSEVVRITG